MKPAKLVLKITTVLSLTFVVSVRPALQGQAQPGQPVISLDFAQYCIGDSWKLKLSNGLPNTSTRLSGSSNGQSWEITDWRKTDAGGNLSGEGTFTAEAVGSHTVKLDIGGNVSTNTISFHVLDCRLKGPRIAFVSTRDGGRPPAGYLTVPYIYVANADGSGVTRLTRGERPSWSADGQRIAFHSWSSGAAGSGRVEIRVINADGSNERVVGPGSFPSWSPDGTKIVFFSATGGPEGGIFMMNADGSNRTQLISNEFASPGGGDYAVSLPTWSPDGRSIAFVRSNYEDPWTVHILDLARFETSLLNIRETVGWSRPVWSPDGTRLLLQVSKAIVSVNRNGSDLQGHLEDRYWSPERTHLANPDWSLDGRSIVFDKLTASEDQRSQSRMRIWVLEDGSVRQLIPDAVAPALPDYWDSQPAWSRVRR
jgi:Tol biopolymer transport system component